MWVTEAKKGGDLRQCRRRQRREEGSDDAQKRRNGSQKAPIDESSSGRQRGKNAKCLIYEVFVYEKTCFLNQIRKVIGNSKMCWKSVANL